MLHKTSRITMLEKAILHIGLHKTGSSSIQASLEGYDDGTRFYADLGWINHSIPLYTAFSHNSAHYHIWTRQGASREHIRETKEQTLRKLELQLSRPSHDTIIFSGEDISHLSQPDANALVGFLRKNCKQIIAVAYVRDPLDYAASAFQQLVKGGCKQVPSRISQHIEARIGIWEQVLGSENVYIRSFDRQALHNGCVVQDFCTIAGLDFNQIRLKRRNESLSGAATKILFHLNQTSPLQFGDAALSRTRRRLINLLAKLFVDTPRIDKHLFFDYLDLQDIEYIKSKDLLTTASRPPDNQSQAATTLTAWLNSLDDNIYSKLSEWLTEQGEIQSWSGNTSELIHRTFYAVLQSDITNTNAKLFRACALTLKGCTNGRISECIALLELASHGKPFNQEIKKNLQELQQLNILNHQASP
jgi:hypothetical protein